MEYSLTYNHQSQFIEMFGGENISSSTIGECACTFIDGDWIESKDQSESGIRLIQTGNIGNGVFKDKEEKSRFISEETFNRLNCSRIFKGDILVSRLPDPIGRACIVPEIDKAITAVDCTIIRLKSYVLPEFFIAYTKTSTYLNQIKKAATGTTRRRISRANLAKIIIPVPPIELQEEFAAIVRQADKSKFDGFKSQFIEMFGGVNSFSTLQDLISDTFPGEWGNEPTTHKAIRVIRTTNFTNEGKLDLSEVVTREIDSKKVSRKKLKKGDIILERSGGTKDNPVGRVVFFEEDGDYLFNNFTQVLRPNKGINPVYLFYSLYNSYNLNKAAMRAMASQTTGIQNLSMSDYMTKQICIPPKELQDKFEAIYRQADKSKYYVQNKLNYICHILTKQIQLKRCS